MFIRHHFYTVRILLDGAVVLALGYLDDVKISSSREKPMQRADDVSPKRQQSRTNTDGGRCAVPQDRGRTAARAPRRSIAVAPTRSSRRPARTGSSAMACCTPSISRTVAPAIATPLGAHTMRWRGDAAPRTVRQASAGRLADVPGRARRMDGGVANTNGCSAGRLLAARRRPHADRDRAAQPASRG